MRSGYSLLTALTGAALLATVATAQELPRKMTSADSFLEERGEDWRVVNEPASGNPAFVYGSRYSLGVAPRTEAGFIAAAKQVVNENTDFFGFDSVSLELTQVKYLNLSRIGSSDKVAVLFDQVIDGIPVFNGSVSILFDQNSGDVLALDSTGVPFAQEAALFPVSDTDEALAAIQPEFTALMGSPFTQVDDFQVQVFGPSAFFGAKNALTSRGATLGYVFDLSAPGSLDREGLPVSGRAYVSAEGDLTVFKLHSLVYNASGNVKGNVNLGQEPNTSSNQEQPNLEHMHVRLNNSGGALQDTTDASGNYDSGGGTETLFFELRGPWVNVNNFGGSDSSFTLSSVSGSGNDVLFNPTKGEFTTGEVAGFYWVNTFHNWVKATDAGDTTLDSALPTNVNRNDLTCNAYYTGGTINLQRAEGSCANTAYQDVILHEEGHWANVEYNGGVTGAFHEGNADAFTYYITDDWCLRHFIGSGCLRSALQTSVMKCPVDGDESCNGGSSHTEGQAIASALWAVRDNLNTTHGNATGDSIADVLMSGWMNVYNDSAILNVIQDHWLALDDDNGDLGDLTPNFGDITSGFAAYNWPAFPDVLISNVAGPATNAEIPDLAGTVITADIQALLGGSSITSASLFYSTGGAFSSVAMSPTGNPNEYSGTIPGFISPNSVRWYISADSSGGNTGNWPAAAPDNFEMYHHGIVVVYNSYDFEGGSDEGWTHVSLSGGSSGDQWNRNNPANSNAASDPGQAYSGTRVWGTDLSPTGFDGLYEPNASGELRSPTYNFSGESEVRLQYRRWLAVEESQYDDADIRINNTLVYKNPASGHTLDTEWMLHEIDISAQAAGNSSVQVKYRITADGGLEFGGWNLDDLMLYRVDPTPTGSFTQYGTGFPGTGGNTPDLDGTGNPVVGNLVSIDVTNGLSSGIGLLLVGNTQSSIPLMGGGFLLTSGILETSLLTLDGSGSTSLSGTLTPGASGNTYYFQFFGQDTGSANSKYSASNGLRMIVP